MWICHCSLWNTLHEQFRVGCFLPEPRLCDLGPYLGSVSMVGAAINPLNITPSMYAFPPHCRALHSGLKGDTSKGGLSPKLRVHSGGSEGDFFCFHSVVFASHLTPGQRVCNHQLSLRDQVLHLPVRCVANISVVVHVKPLELVVFMWTLPLGSHIDVCRSLACALSCRNWLTVVWHGRSILLASKPAE